MIELHQCEGSSSSGNTSKVKNICTENQCIDNRPRESPSGHREPETPLSSIILGSLSGSRRHPVDPLGTGCRAHNGSQRRHPVDPLGLGCRAYNDDTCRPACEPLTTTAPRVSDGIGVPCNVAIGRWGAHSPEGFARKRVANLPRPSWN